MRTRPIQSLAALLVSISLAACAGGASPSAASPSPASSPTPSASTPGGASPSTPPYSSLLQPAAAEGTVNFQIQSSISMGDADVASAISQGVQALYGIKVAVNVDSSLSYNAAMAKTVTEVQAGAPTTYDLMYQDTITSLPGIDAGIVQSVDWQTLFPWITTHDLAYDGLLPIPAAVFNLPAYNTNLVTGSNVPTKWDDLLNPMWRGKIGTTSYQEPWLPLALPAAWGEAKLVQFVTNLSHQNPILGRYGDLHQKLISGGLSIVALDNADWVQYDSGKGAPIALANLQPVLVVTKVLVVPKGSAHSEAAQLVAGWLLSDAGQAFMDKAYTSSPFRAGTLSAKFLEGKQWVSPDPAFLRSDGSRIVTELTNILVKS